MAALDITPVAASAWDAPATATSTTPAYPAGIAEFDRVYLIVASKQTTAAGSTIATPTNFALVDQRQVGATAVTPANGTGSTRIAVFSRTVPSGGLTGTVTVAVANGNSTLSCMVAFRPQASSTTPTWAEAVAGSADRATAATAIGGAHPTSVAWAPKDYALLIASAGDDTSPPFAMTSFTGSGLTFGTIVATPDTGAGTTTGFDTAACVWYAPETAGSATTAVTSAGTQATSETSGVLAIRFRADGTPLAPKNIAMGLQTSTATAQTFGRRKRYSLGVAW